MAHLSVRNAGGTFCHDLGTQTVSIGRDEGNLIALPDDSVSGRHAEIRYEAGVYILRDLGSTNGTTANGGPVVETTLGDGDILAFGKVIARFERGSNPRAFGERNPRYATACRTFLMAANTILREACKHAVRFVRIAWIDLNVAKLITIDLNRLRFRIGRRFEDSEFVRLRFPQEHAEIASLLSRMQASKSAREACIGDTKEGAVKRFGSYLLAAVSATIYRLRLNLLRRNLGSQIGSIRDGSDVPRDQVHAICAVTNKIEQLEALRSNLLITVNCPHADEVDTNTERHPTLFAGAGHNSGGPTDLVAVKRLRYHINNRRGALIAASVAVTVFCVGLTTKGIFSNPSAKKCVKLATPDGGIAAEGLAREFPGRTANGPFLKLCRDVWESGPIFVQADSVDNGVLDSAHYFASSRQTLDLDRVLRLHAGSLMWNEAPIDPRMEQDEQDPPTRCWIRSDGKYIASYPVSGFGQYRVGIWIRTPEYSRWDVRNEHASIRRGTPIGIPGELDPVKWLAGIRRRPLGVIGQVHITLDQVQMQLTGLTWETEAASALEEFPRSTAYIGYDQQQVRCFLVVAGNRVRSLTATSLAGDSEFNKRMKDVLGEGSGWHEFPAGLAIEGGSTWVRLDGAAIIKTIGGEGRQRFVFMSRDFAKWLDESEGPELNRIQEELRKANESR